MINRIEIVCDDRRHIGQLGEVATFHHARGGWHSMTELPHRFRARRKGDDETVFSVACPLCPQQRPQQFEASSAKLQWLLDAVAEQGVSQPTLQVVNLLLSNRP